MAIRTGPTLYTSNILGPPAPPTRAAFLWEYIMPNSTRGIGSFTADTIVAILRALPETLAPRKQGYTNIFVANECVGIVGPA